MTHTGIGQMFKSFKGRLLLLGWIFGPQTVSMQPDEHSGYCFPCTVFDRISNSTSYVRVASLISRRDWIAIGSTVLDAPELEAWAFQMFVEKLHTESLSFGCAHQFLENRD